VNIAISFPKKLTYLSLETLYLSLFKKTMKLLQPGNKATIDVMIVSSKTMRYYNRTYRQKDYPTDVLSFPFYEGVFPTKWPQEIPLGQIIINYQKASSQAKAYGHSPTREFSFLFVHGLLHILGYHHDTIEAEQTMIALQNTILGKRV
jgi:probable rRNA maturation factor